MTSIFGNGDYVQRRTGMEAFSSAAVPPFGGTCPALATSPTGTLTVRQWCASAGRRCVRQSRQRGSTCAAPTVRSTHLVHSLSAQQSLQKLGTKHNNTAPSEIRGFAACIDTVHTRTATETLVGAGEADPTAGNSVHHL